MSDERLKIVNASGFLFQSRVEHEVDSTIRRPGWKVLAREYAWRDQKGEEHYADMILGKGAMFFVVECKRTQQADWVFVVEEQPTRSRVRCHLRTLPYARGSEIRPVSAPFLRRRLRKSLYRGDLCQITRSSPNPC